MVLGVRTPLIFTLGFSVGGGGAALLLRGLTTCQASSLFSRQVVIMEFTTTSGTDSRTCAPISVHYKSVYSHLCQRDGNADRGTKSFPSGNHSRQEKQSGKKASQSKPYNNEKRKSITRCTSKLTYLTEGIGS